MLYEKLLASNGHTINLLEEREGEFVVVKSFQKPNFTYCKRSPAYLKVSDDKLQYHIYQCNSIFSTHSFTKEEDRENGRAKYSWYLNKDGVKQIKLNFDASGAKFLSNDYYHLRLRGDDMKIFKIGSDFELKLKSPIFPLMNGYFVGTDGIKVSLFRITQEKLKKCCTLMRFEPPIRTIGNFEFNGKKLVGVRGSRADKLLIWDIENDKVTDTKTIEVISNDNYAVTDLLLLQNNKIIVNKVLKPFSLDTEIIDLTTKDYSQRESPGSLSCVYLSTDPFLVLQILRESLPVVLAKETISMI